MKKNIVRNQFRLVLAITVIISLFSIVSCVSTRETVSGGPRYDLYGGPKGGTFLVFAKGITKLAKNKGINIQPKSSLGAFENVRKVNSNSASFAFSYSSVIYLARNGLLKNDIKKYNDIMVLGYFYGAPAQLVVKKGSEITSAYQLEGKKIGVGNAGSGAAYQAKVFFKELGIWEKLNRKYIGYNDASEAFSSGDLDAFWLFTAFPSGAVIMAAHQNDIHLINIYEDGLNANLFQKHPYFERITIPPDTYKGVSQATDTFQDSALLIANKNVPDDVVYQLLEEVYSKKGFKHMRSIKKTALMMAQNNGSFGISTPLHPGAKKYYDDQNFDLSR